MGVLMQGEEALRASGVPYTVVRPGGLTGDPAGQARLVAAQGDRGSGRVGRADVAAVCVAALTGTCGCLHGAAVQGGGCPGSLTADSFHLLRIPPAADPAAKNVTLELTSQPWAAGEAAVPLAQQLKGLFAGLKPGGTAP